MTHLDIELKKLKDETTELFELVFSQLRKSQLALIHFDKDMAHEVNFNEKRVNAMELNIDKDCENIFALFNPLAIDLRFVLAVLKINYNLERIGDIADGIARHVIDGKTPFSQELLDISRLNEMFNTASEMLLDTQLAFQGEDAKLARGVFQKDELLDRINGTANQSIENFIRSNSEQIAPALHVISTVRKLERTGDQVKNIAEEIIFFIEAKVLKHKRGN
jgi:phosphate transport system protein